MASEEADPCKRVPMRSPGTSSRSFCPPEVHGAMPVVTW